MLVKLWKEKNYFPKLKRGVQIGLLFYGLSTEYPFSSEGAFYFLVPVFKRKMNSWKEAVEK